MTEWIAVSFISCVSRKYIWEIFDRIDNGTNFGYLETEDELAKSEN